jgi:ribose transport system permease protein
MADAARASTAPIVTKSRIDPLAIAVRFQSVIGLIVVAIGGVIFSPRRHGLILFLAPDNMANIVRAVSETGIIAVGMTFVIITAGIDLSVGALLSLSSVLTASIMTTAGWGLIPTVLFVVACGTVFGALQGLISTRFRLEPFIVTLAGLQVARGLALVISNNQYINISYGEGPGLAPPVFAILGDRLFNNTVPVATLVFVVVAVVAVFVLNFTRFGRYVFAVGGNERAARLSGVPVRMVKISVYAITGLVSAIAGIVHAGQFNFGSRHRRHESVRRRRFASRHRRRRRHARRPRQHPSAQQHQRGPATPCDGSDHRSRRSASISRKSPRGIGTLSQQERHSNVTGSGIWVPQFRDGIERSG